MASKIYINSDRPSLIYPRILGYTVTLVVHLANAMYIASAFKPNILEDPYVKMYYDNQLRFLTVWNVLIQMFYSILGLLTDIIAITSKSKEHVLLKMLKKIRESLFSTLVVPLALLVPLAFWSCTLYDKGLILHASIKKVLTPLGNHILHTAVLPFALWELTFFPRQTPKSHTQKLHLIGVFLFIVTYIIKLFHTYFTTGVWLYPIFDMMNSLQIFGFLFINIVVMLTSYHLQWPLNSLRWDDNNNNNVKYD